MAVEPKRMNEEELVSLENAQPMTVDWGIDALNVRRLLGHIAAQQPVVAAAMKHCEDNGQFAHAGIVAAVEAWEESAKGAGGGN